jgi:hypothetical protein
LVCFRSAFDGSALCRSLCWSSLAKGRVIIGDQRGQE